MHGVNGTRVELDQDRTDADMSGTSVVRPFMTLPWVMVAIMMLLAGVIRLWRIEFQSFWLDEAHTAFYIQGQTPEVIWAHLIKPGENGPVYYALLVPWARLLGGSELSLRGFSLVVSLPSVPLAFAVLRRLVPVRTALLGAGMVAFAPYLTWYAQEAKMYALVLTGGLATQWLFLSACERGGVWRWLAYGAVSLLAVYVHFFALLTIGVQALVAVVLAWPNRRRLLGAWATVLAVLVPVVVRQLPAITRDVAGSAPKFAGGRSLLAERQGILTYAYTMNVTPVPLALVLFVGTALVFLGTWVLLSPAVGRIVASWREVVVRGLPVPDRGSVALWALAYGPVAGFGVASMILDAGLFADRYFIASVPLIYGTVAVAVVWVLDRRPWIGGSVLALLGFGAVIGTVYQATVPVKDDFRTAMAMQRAGRGTRDAVVPVPQFLSYPVGYHSAPGLDIVFVDMERPPVDYAVKFAGRTGVWLVTNLPGDPPPLKDVRDWLAEHGRLGVDERLAGGVQLQRWVLDEELTSSPELVIELPEAGR